MVCNQIIMLPSVFSAIFDTLYQIEEGGAATQKRICRLLRKEPYQHH